MKRLKNPLRGLACAAMFVSGSAALAQTDPVGYTTLTVHANAYSLLGEQVFTATAAAGSIDFASGNVVSDLDVNFGAILTGSQRAVLEVPPKVIDVLFVVGNTLTLAEPVPAGTLYRLRKLRRLSEIFSPTLVPEFNPTENFNPDTGDLFMIRDGTGGYRQFFFSVQPGLVGYFNAGTGEPEDPFLRYTDALLVKRQGETYFTAISGELKLSNTSIPLTARFNAIGVVSPLPTLGNVNLAATLQSGTPATADIVWVQDVFSGGFRRYFHSDGTGPGLTTGWRDANPEPGSENADAGDTWLSPGVIVRRRGSVPHTVVMSPPPYVP